MATLNLTVEVLSLSPKVTCTELSIFFSYCGTVDKIQLQRNKDQSQSALVTFRQPFAYKTALLLNDATVAGQPIRVLPAKDSSQQIHILSAKNIANPHIPDELTDKTKNDEIEGLIPSVHAACNLWLQKVLKGGEIWNRTVNELDENYKLSKKGRVLVDQTGYAVSAAEQAAGHIGTWSYSFVSAGTSWLSGVLEKASKCVSKLGNRKRGDSNSRKQK